MYANHTTPLIALVKLLVVACVVACGASAPSPSTGGAPVQIAATAQASMPLEPKRATASAQPKEQPRGILLPLAKARFDEVLSLIRERYVDADVSDDLLWTGAIEGMLNRLIRHKSIMVNQLMSPESLRLLQTDLKGTLSGIGVVLVGPLSGVYVVNDMLPGSPAAAAGLRKDDRVLRVGEASLGALSLREVVELIRGEEGTTVQLVVQREEKTWPVTLTRRRIEIPNVTHEVLAPGVGYLSIASFNEKTVERIDAALLDLNTRGALRGLVLDLRNCLGGLLPASLSAAGRFLPKGARIASIKRRAGVEQPYVAEHAPKLDIARIAVLTSGNTASSAELLTAALREHGRATVLGERTAGKWTVEEILELEGGAALRLTIGRLHSAKGRHLQNEGVEPDIALAPNPEGAAAPGKRAEDVQVKAAMRVLGVAQP